MISLKRIETIFNEAITLEADLRINFVESTCKGEKELRDAVLTLLRFEESKSRFMEEPLMRPRFAFDDLGALTTSRNSVPGYEVLSLIGRGGSSSVYLAHHPDHGRVALKVLDYTMAGSRRAARFDDEIRILAQLHHPSLVDLHESGITRDGRPFFAMDFVAGIPVTDYCHRSECNLEQRLRLFIRICDVVFYAHSNLIVHRDIKPGNVLVDECGTPKVLDFGIARRLDEFYRDRTSTHSRVMTPGYAAPEQFKGEHISTATDVYSLGVLLFELLTGTRPFHWDGKTLRDIQEDWEHKSVPLASKVLSSIDPDNAYYDNRFRSIGLTRAAMVRRLDGDLDNIIQKSLQYEPRYRYSSVQKMADDIQYHLNGHPISARPPSRTYYFTKFIRRHSWATAYLTTFFLLLVTFATVVGIQSQHVKKQRDYAQIQHGEAKYAKEQAETVARFLVEGISQADSKWGRGAAVPTLEILDLMTQRVESELGDQPQIQATLWHNLGSAYSGIGFAPRAQNILERALAMRIQMLGYDDANTASTQFQLATVLVHLGDLAHALDLSRNALNARMNQPDKRLRDIAESYRQLASIQELMADYGEALDSIEIAIKHHVQINEESEQLRDLVVYHRILRSMGHDPSQNPVSLPVLPHMGEAADPVSLQLIADVYMHAGAYREASQTYENVVHIIRRLRGADHPSIIPALLDCAAAFLAHGNQDKAMSLLQRADDLTRRPESPHSYLIGQILKEKAKIYRDRDQLWRAESTLHEALDIDRDLLGPEHPEVIADVCFLAEVNWLQGRFAEAEALYTDSLNIVLKTVGPKHPLAEALISWIGQLKSSLGDINGGVQLLRQSLALTYDRLGPCHPETARRMSGLAQQLIGIGEFSEAETLFMQALDINMDVHPENLAQLADYEFRIGSIRYLLEDYESSESYLCRALDKRLRCWGGLHSSTAEVMMVLALAYRKQSRYPEAEVLNRKALDIFQRQRGERHWLVGLAWARLAEVLVVQSRLDEAESAAQLALAITVECMPVGHWRIFDARSILASVKTEKGLFEEAERELMKCYEGLVQTRGPDTNPTQSCIDRLVRLYERWQNPEQARTSHDHLENSSNQHR